MCKVFRRTLLIIVKQKGVFISKYAFFIAKTDGNLFQDLLYTF
jgi:hypothetical protein